MRPSLRFRQQFHNAIDLEIAERTAAHQKQIAALKAAGITGSGASDPLVMLAQGDSWFDYPLIGNGPLPGNTDVIAHLEHMGSRNPVIHNIAHFGEATYDELSLPKQQRMIASLQDPHNWLDKGKPDAILISGGGNDIAGDQFCIFLNFAPNPNPLNSERFEDALGMAIASYLDLFAFRDKYAHDVPIFAHCYAFPFVTGVHPICVNHSWLLPSVSHCGWTAEQGTALIRDALTKFKERLQALAGDKNKFYLIDTQKTVLAKELWANELHPTPEGFQLIASDFLDALRAYFPGRI